MLPPTQVLQAQGLDRVLEAHAAPFEPAERLNPRPLFRQIDLGEGAGGARTRCDGGNRRNVAAEAHGCEPLRGPPGPPPARPLARFAGRLSAALARNLRLPSPQNLFGLTALSPPPTSPGVQERNLWWSPAPPEARSRRSSLGKSPSLTARAAERVPVPLKGKGKEDVPGSSSSFRRANSDRSNGTPERSNGFNGTPERHYQPGAQAGQSGPRRAATPPHQPEEPAHLPTVLTPSARAPPEGGEVPPLLEHCVLLGASPQALDAAWAAAAPQLGAGGQLGLRCEPEKLVCFPAVPEVEALEHFCFPQLVPVACSLRDRAHPGGDPAGAPVLLGRTTFVLHTSKGHDALTDKLFGVCLYWDHPLLLSAAPPPPPRADAPPRADRERAGVRSVLVRSRRCLCLLSRVALFDLHVRALALIVRNEVARDAELIAAGAGAARAVGLSPASVRVLEEYFLARAAPPDAQRAQCALAVAGAELVFRWDAETLERQEEAASVRAGMALLFGHLSMRNVITALTAMLLERRVVVQCGDLAILTAITLALPYLLRPYRWVNAALPLVPPALDAFLAAPVPFVAGPPPPVVLSGHAVSLTPY